MMKLVFLIRSVLGLIFAVFHTLLASLAVTATAMIGWDVGVDKTIGFWGRTILKVFSISVQFENLENLPRDRGVLLLINHQSLVDIPVIHGHVPKRTRFGAKSELFKIPFFGIAMRKAGTLPIVRESRNETFRVYKEAEEKFNRNWNFVLAPEGTRQPEPVIGRFKKGPFLFAINAQAPIVPVVICGSYEALPKKSLLPNLDRWSRTIRVRFLPAQETKGLSPADAAMITEKTRERMVAAFNEMHATQT